MHFVIGDTGEPAAGASAPDAGENPPAVTREPAAPVREPPAAAAPVQKKQAVKSTSTTTAARGGPAYWIQTGSYTSQTRAEELATTLEGKGLAGRVFSYTSGPQTYFRVRVGPYANKGEAEKFLASVRRIQGLEASFISMVGTAAKLN
jgi:cell division septation protein DedD